MSAERFSLDSNILIYALDATDSVKNGLCTEIVRRAAARDCALTLQSLGEFYNIATRKLSTPATSAALWVNEFLRLFTSIAPDERALRNALGHTASARASYWDAMLMETASENGCTAVISEDMADGALFGHARVVHPFVGDRLSEDVLALLD